jgi:tetratricopeptide (TPR) repeat protein
MASSRWYSSSLWRAICSRDDDEVYHNLRMRSAAVSLVIWLYLCAAFSAAAQRSSAPSENDPTAFIKQAQKLNSEGRQDDALAFYRKALELAPNDPEAHLGAGMALDLKGSYDQARQHFAQAIESLAPEKKDQGLRALAISYAFEQNPGQAAKFEQQVFDARNGKQDFIGAAETANELARIYLECGDADNAYGWYQRGNETALRKTDLSESDKNLWLFRWEHAQARIAARRGQHEEAQKHVVAAKLALDKANNPEQARFYPYLTGYVAFYNGDYKTAIADLQKADQRDPLILCLLAQAYEKSGDQAKAMDYYRKVLSSSAHNPTNAFARPLARKKVASSGV